MMETFFWQIHGKIDLEVFSGYLMRRIKSHINSDYKNIRIQNKNVFMKVWLNLFKDLQFSYFCINNKVLNLWEKMGHMSTEPLLLEMPGRICLLSNWRPLRAIRRDELSITLQGCSYGKQEPFSMISAQFTKNVVSCVVECFTRCSNCIWVIQRTYAFIFFNKNFCRKDQVMWTLKLLLFHIRHISISDRAYDTRGS